MNYSVSNGWLKSSLTLTSYTTVLSNPSAMGGLCLLVLRVASLLDAFRAYQLSRSCPAMLMTTGIPEATSARSSRTQALFLSRGDTPRRYYRTVSRRTEPSSCGTLMDEQPNPWSLLHDQDVPSRQRCTKPRGRYVRCTITLSKTIRLFRVVKVHFVKL